MKNNIFILSGDRFDGDIYFSSFFKAYYYSVQVGFVTPEYDHQYVDVKKLKAAKDIKEFDFAEIDSDLGICIKRRELN